MASQMLQGGAADAVLEVPLQSGVNTVTVLDVDTRGQASNPLSVEVTAPRVVTRPDVWVVSVGVNWYPNLAPQEQLHASVNDARAVAEAFAAQAGPGKHYAASHVLTLVDEQVTPEAVRGALATLSAMKPDDVAVVFFAGHGVKSPSDDMLFLTHHATGRLLQQHAPALWRRLEERRRRGQLRSLITYVAQ